MRHDTDWKHTQPAGLLLHLSAMCLLQSFLHQEPNVDNYFTSFSVDIHSKYLYTVHNFCMLADSNPYLINTFIIV